MQTQLKGKDFITTQDWTVEELETAIASLDAVPVDILPIFETAD